MVPRKSARQAAKQQKAAEVVEISSDSEREVAQHEVEPEVPRGTASILDKKELTEEDYVAQPLLRAEGIRYDLPGKTIPGIPEPKPRETKPEPAASAKLPVRVKDTGSRRHRHVSIEIQLPTSSTLSKGKEVQEIPDSDDGSEEEHSQEVFKTPLGRQHITFHDSDIEEFVTPMEAPLRNPLETSLHSSRAPAEVEEGEEDSDDEAPEAVSSHAAGAQLAKASKAVAKAAERQAAAQKRKRQERDAFLKQQAERKSASKPIEISSGSGDETPVEAPAPTALFPEKRKRETPAILPQEFLVSDSEDEDQQSRKTAANRALKKQKVGPAGSTWITETTAPRDKKVGSTVYRIVSTTGDGKLAPKAKKQSQNLKQLLLHRNRAPQAKKGGFFVKNR